MFSFHNYKYVVIGAGFFGSVVAERIANVLNEKVLVIEKRDHLGGNCYSEIDPSTGIEFHKYGTHIFHTSNQTVWNYINSFTDFNGYFHQVLTTYKNKVYQMPINLETINSFYGVNLKPFEVNAFIEIERIKENIPNPANFEEKAISLIGRPLYEAFIRGYTIKQWQKHPRDLPAEILNRLPFRSNYNESYFHDKWQGIPENGYSEIFNKMLDHENIDVHLNTDYFDILSQLSPDSTIVYSGPVDRFFDYKFGHLEWRTLNFQQEIIDVDDYQGTSVMNYAEETVPFTRIHEPKHLHIERDYPKDKTLIIKEYSKKDNGSEPYYPINDDKNRVLLQKYLKETKKHSNIHFSGRLGEYKYYDMHHTIENALNLFENKLRPTFKIRS